MSRLAVSLLLMAGLIAGCGGDDPMSSAETHDETESSLPVIDLFSQPVADDPNPAMRAGAAADFVECTYEISQGGWSMDFGAAGGGSDPDEGLARFVEDPLFAIPREGYVAVGKDRDRMLYTYSAKGVAKVAVIVADSSNVELDAPDGWVVETFASCDPAEFDPSADDQLLIDVWLDADGERVPTSVITSLPGPGHCNWESVTFLHLEDRQYIGDPDGVMAGFEFASPFSDKAELPTDATDTGYHREGRQLWLSADKTIAYIVTDDGVEAWPTSSEPIGCS